MFYRIEQLDTTGWIVVENCTHLTKEDARQSLESLIAEGYNPNALRLQIDD